MPHPSWGWVCAIALSIVAGGGCALLTSSAPWRETKSVGTGTSPSALPAIPTPSDAIRLEIVFVERPADDPLLASALWNDIDQVGAIKGPVRQELERNGFRIGHVGCDPPQALQTLLELKSSTDGRDDVRKLTGRRVALRSGSETEIQTSQLLTERRVNLPLAGESREKTFQSARGVFRLRAEREQDGWCRLEFLPEVHHGEQRLRHVAGDAGWEFRTTQNIEPLYKQKFHVNLNVGEMVVIGTNSRESTSLGGMFFGGDDPDAAVPLQRLVVIRLLDIAKSDAIFTP